MTVANTDKPGEVSIPIGGGLNGRSPGYVLSLFLVMLSLNMGDHLLGRNVSSISRFVLEFIPMFTVWGVILCVVMPWVSGQVVVSADGLAVRRWGRDAFSFQWAEIGAIRVLPLYFWSTTSRLEVAGVDGKRLGFMLGPGTRTGAHEFYYLVSALLPPTARIVRVLPSRGWGQGAPSPAGEVEEPRLRDMAVKTSLLLHHMGGKQTAAYSVKRQWDVQPKPALEPPLIFAICFLGIIVGSCIGLMSLLPGGQRQDLRTLPLTAPVGFVELLLAFGLVALAFRHSLAHRAVERDVKAGRVDQIEFDGDSAWLIEAGGRIPITGLRPLTCSGREESRIRTGVMTPGGSQYFDPSRLTIDPEPPFDPSIPPPLPPDAFVSYYPRQTGSPFQPVR